MSAAYPSFSSLWSAVGMVALALPALADSSVPSPKTPCPPRGGGVAPSAKKDEPGTEKGKAGAKPTPAPTPKKPKREDPPLAGLMMAPTRPSLDPRDPGQSPSSLPVIHPHGPADPCFSAGERVYRVKLPGK